MTNSNSDRASKLRQVQKYYFAAHDLHLFLDTHPYNKEALKMYAEMVKKAETAKKEFENEFGPLSVFSAADNTERWTWIDNPWPWDNIDE